MWNTLVFFFAFVSCLEAIRLDENNNLEEMQKDLMDQLLQKQSSKVPQKTHVLIIGNVRTGKSTLCQWLLGRTDVCTVYKNLGEGNTDVNTLVTGHWFGFPELGELDVIDTVGFLRGDPEPDGENWNDLVEYAKANMPNVDAVIFTSSTTAQTLSQAEKVVSRVRHTFGTALWDNVIFVGNPGDRWKRDNGAGGQYTQARLDDLERVWSNVDSDPNSQGVFYKVEFEEAPYWSLPENANTKIELETEIGGIKFFAPYMVVNNYFGMVDPRNPQWSPTYVPSSANRALECRLDQLETIRLQVQTKNTERAAWDISSVRARFGPSSVTDGQAFECAAPNACGMRVAGQHLSDADRLQVFPDGHQCGDAFEWPVDVPEPVEFLVNLPDFQKEGDPDTFRDFTLGTTANLGMQATSYQLCYCEYGYCDTSKRFGQPVGTLEVKAVQCQVECATDDDGHTVEPCGSVDGVDTNVVYEESVTFTCKTGYGVQRDPLETSFERVCSGNTGLFSDPVAPATRGCEKVECQAPAQLPNAIMQSDANTEYLWTDAFRFMCDEGFSQDGDADARFVDVACAPDGTWQLADPNMDWQTYSAHGCRRWAATEWETCKEGCGKQTQNRKALCEPAGASCNEGFKPDLAQECISTQTCPHCGALPDLTLSHAKPSYASGSEWVVTNGDAVYYECDYMNGYTLTGASWSPGSPTGFQVSCVLHDTLKQSLLKWKTDAGVAMTDEYVQSDDAKVCRRWETTPWSTCSVTCGSGYRFRQVQCSTGDNDDCPPDAKPRGVDLSKSCFVSDACDLEGKKPNNHASPAAAAPALLVWSFVAVACSELVRSRG